MKKSLLAIALAAVMTPFVFAAQAPAANAGQPAATGATHMKKATTKKAKKATGTSKAKKGTKAAASTAASK
jgi:hypothetical protein